MASRELTQLSVDLAKKNKGGSGAPGSGMNADSDVGSSVRDLSPVDDSSKAYSDMALNTMASAFKDGGSLASRQKTIMEKFAARATLNQEGGAAERELINANAADNIETTLESNAREYVGAIEGQNMGLKTAAVRYMENTGAKRVRDLEKARDNLLLTAKVQEASRLDNLIIEEEKAITDARTNFINELLGISTEARAQSAETRAVAGENREIAGFETPEEARIRDLVSGQAGAQLEAVRNLALTAPDAGITPTDTFESAVEKYRGSSTYKRNERAAELELEQIQAQINSSNRANQPTGGSGGGSTSGTYSTDLEFITDAASAVAAQGGKFSLENFNRRIGRARDDADRVAIVADTILANAPAETRNRFNNDSAAIANIDQAILMLEDGVETGFLNNAAQYTYNIVGKDFDPKLTEINQYITAALQPYRSNITGAAWGQQETKEYERLFGNTKYAPEELLTRLRGLKGIMLNKTSNALNGQVNPLGTTRNFFSEPLGVGNGTTRALADDNMFSNTEL